MQVSANIQGISRIRIRNMEYKEVKKEIWTKWLILRQRSKSEFEEIPFIAQSFLLYWEHTGWSPQWFRDKTQTNTNDVQSLKEKTNLHIRLCRLLKKQKGEKKRADLCGTEHWLLMLTWILTFIKCLNTGLIGAHARTSLIWIWRSGEISTSLLAAALAARAGKNTKRLKKKQTVKHKVYYWTPLLQMWTRTCCKQRNVLCKTV